MAEGDGVIYNAFKLNLLNGIFDLANAADDVKVTLHTAYTPDIDAHGVWLDTGVSTTEYSTADGYTAGGKSLVNQATAQDNANDLANFDADDLTWTALGALTPATPSHAIVWDTTPTSPADPLICYFELGATATNGGDYKLQWHTNGIVRIT